MDYVLVVTALAVSLGLVSQWLHGVPVSEPMIGLGFGMALGPGAFGLLVSVGDQGVFLTLTRVLLAFTVMTVALRYPWRTLRYRVRPVLLLLGIVLPLMAATVGVAGHTVLGLDWSTAFLLGAILAPTDPVLVSSVVSGKAAVETLPAHLRETLSLESGANDGLGLVLVVLGLSLTQDHTGSWLLLHAIVTTVGGVAVGVAMGLAAGRLVGWSRAHQTEGTFLLFTLTFSLLVLAICVAIGIDGILAVFVGGLAYNRSISDEDRRRQSVVEEGVDRLLLLPVFVILGASIPWHQWQATGWSLLGFIVLVLLVRRLPWVLALGPFVRFGRSSRLWLGWFGPVGVAALFYVSLAAGEGETDPVLWAAASAAVVASTFVHGATALPGRIWAGRREDIIDHRFGDQLDLDPEPSGRGA